MPSEILVQGDTAKIPLTGIHGEGKHALVDSSDLPLTEGVNWYLAPGGYGYTSVAGRLHGKKVRLSRLIMGAQPDQLVDIANGNSLDLRRSNLRLCSRQLDSYNRKKYSSSRNDFKGIRRVGRYWAARITVNGKRTHLGTFASPEAAAAAYNLAARERHEAFARLNEVAGYAPRRKQHSHEVAAYVARRSREEGVNPRTVYRRLARGEAHG